MTEDVCKAGEHLSAAELGHIIDACSVDISAYQHGLGGAPVLLVVLQCSDNNRHCLKTNVRRLVRGHLVLLLNNKIPVACSIRSRRPKSWKKKDS